MQNALHLNYWEHMQRAIIAPGRALYSVLFALTISLANRTVKVHAIFAHHFEDCRHFLIKIHSTKIVSACVTKARADSHDNWHL